MSFQISSFHSHHHTFTHLFIFLSFGTIIPNFTHKGRLYYLKNPAVEFAGTLDSEMKSLQHAIVVKTKAAIEDDF